MKKITLLLLIINLYITAFNQVVRGTVCDNKTKNTICFATVYFNGTFIGTTADQDGRFELSVAKNKSMPMTISAIGYYSVTLTNFSKTEPLLIYLEPKTYEIGEVIVSTRSLESKRRRNLALFREEFIGTTYNAQNCKILNEGDITFNYYSDKDTIKAYALKPILVENKSLGYKITYYLDKFEFYKDKQATFFCGNIIFNEDLAVDNVDKDLYVRARKVAYLGSRMHFFRELWSSTLESSGFTVINPKYEELPILDFVSIDGNNKFLKYHSNLYVKFENRKSIIEFLEDKVYFDESGFFNPGINWKGDMAKQRVADWLPYEYSFGQ